MTLYFNYCNLVIFTVTAFIALYVGIPPDWRWWLVITLILFGSIRIPSLRCCYPLLLALGVILFNNYLFQKKIENLFQEGEDIIINARVESFFDQITYGYKSLIKIYAINGKQLPLLFRPRIQIVYPQSTQLRLGEHWKLKVKLTEVNGRLNEAGFDQEKYFLSQNWQAKGALQASDENHLLKPSNSYRLVLHQRMQQQSQLLPQRAILTALSFGDRSQISDSQWLQLKNSGLIHLVAISGLHIGMAFVFGWKLGVAIRWVCPQGYWLPLGCAMVLALSYSWLAGFSLPTVRALLMCSILAFFHLQRLHYSQWFIFLLTLNLLLIFDPLSLLSMSFWMSFSAVFVIYLILRLPYVNQQYGFNKWLRIQLILSLAMLPFTILFFDGISLMAPLYNLWCIPWFTFVLIPLLFLCLFLTMICPEISSVFWNLLDDLLTPVMFSLQYATSSWLTFPSGVGVILLFIALLFIVRGLLGEKLHNLLVLSSVSLVMLSGKNSVDHSAVQPWQVSILDVGHGLAVMITSGDKVALYDTGNRWGQGSIAQSVIIPVLMKRGHTEIDTLILSHLDSDHAAGKSIVEQQLKPQHKYASQLMAEYQPCIQGVTWQWQQLQFAVLWPPKQVIRAYNPHSCVIKISDGISSVLLTGDITTISEWLLVRQPEQLQADVLLVPHHGSNSSSSMAFINAVSPSVAIASVAKNNQWHLPSSEVKARYSQNGTKWFDTGQSGQINIDFDSTGWVLSEMRASQSLAWYRQMLRKGVE